MRNVRKLEVTEHAQSLAVAVYAITAGFPSHERFGLAAQMRRAAVSVASNIAEGAGRGGDRELLHFLFIALGSATELAVQVDLAIALELMSATEGASLADRVNHVQRMLNRFIASVRRKRNGLALKTERTD
jgi:four helix bundle protein